MLPRNSTHSHLKSVIDVNKNIAYMCQSIDIDRAYCAAIGYLSIRIPRITANEHFFMENNNYNNNE